MSQENAEVVLRGYAERARKGVEGVLDFMHPDIEVEESPQFPDTGTYRGHDGVRKLHGLFTEQFDPFEMHVEDIRATGDKVWVALRVGGIGRRSGAPMYVPSFHVLTMKRGKADRLQVFLDRDDALEAAGLRE
jgi:ketosteroid isomerase-like protein